MCKQEQKYLLLFQYPPKFLLYYSRMDLGEILSPKPSRAKRMNARMERRERER
jgi:hypothetical protein